MSKLIAGFITILVPLFLSWLVNLIYVVYIAKVQIGGDGFVRLGWVMGLSVLFIAFFFALGMAVSCCTRRSATSLAACLFFWILFVLAMPNLVPMVIRHFVPIPPQAKILLEKDAIRRHIEKEITPKIREELGATGKYTETQGLMRELWRRTAQEYDKRADKIDQYYLNSIRRQLVLNQQISRISPAASYTYAATMLAGTGVNDFLNITKDVAKFQKQYIEAQEQQEAKRLAEEARRKQLGIKPKPDEKLIDKYDPSLWPRFVPTAIPLSAALNDAWVDVVLLAGGTVILFLTAFVGFMRYDPR